MIGPPLILICGEQVEAATAIRDGHMPGWASTERAMALIAEVVHGLECDAVTVKAAAVHRLYCTHCHHLGDAWAGLGIVTPLILAS